jgi:hypothetical protein
VAPDVHPGLDSLAFLLGSWSGEGEGTYPTTTPFRFREQMRFEHVGTAFILYAQRSWLDEGAPIHFESGVVRPAGSGRVEFALAHPLGLTEISEGTVEGTEIEVTSTSIGRSATGDPVTSLVRRYRVQDGALRYELDMAMEATPLTFHVRGELRRDP